MYPSGSTTWFPLALSSLALLAYAVRRRILWDGLRKVPGSGLLAQCVLQPGFSGHHWL